MKRVFIVFGGLLVGVLAGYVIIKFSFSSRAGVGGPAVTFPTAKSVSREVVGFLPYFLLDKAKTDYSSYITTLDYFGLTIDKDGTILRSTSPVELEPGYYALVSGKLDPFFESARVHNIKLSLTIFGGDQEFIKELVGDPVPHADNLINEISPVMSQYGFSDLNLDIEAIGTASASAQANFTKFVGEVKSQMDQKKLGTLSIDMIPVDFVRDDHMTKPSDIAKYVDKVILMAYDFHSPSSFVTGPVAPLYGARTVAEFDTQVGVEAALRLFVPSKILLGFPTYGYSWETIDNFERAGIVPASVVIESNKDIEDFLAGCSNCSREFDSVAQESYVIYKNSDSGTYQQIFYPDEKGIASKISFVKGNNLGGMAIWALGYEGSSILNPIQSFLSGR